VEVNMPFNPTQGTGKKESRLLRALWALPILAMLALATKVMDPTASMQGIVDIIKAGKITWNGGEVTVIKSFYGIQAVDDAILPIVVVFSQWDMGFDVQSTWQTVTFLIDFAGMYAVFLMESARRANNITVFQLLVYGPRCFYCAILISL
jgi:hypothetical protein